MSGSHLKLSAVQERERAEDEAMRQTIIAALMPAATTSDLGLRVLPLIDIVVAYVRPFRGVVSDVLGTGSGGARQVQRPFSVQYVPADGSVLVSDCTGSCFKRILPDGRVQLLTGYEDVPGFKSAAADDSEYDHPYGVALDPLNAARIYLSDNNSIRVLDTSANGGRNGGTVSLVAGSDESGHRDGRGARARFDCICDLLCTRDGRTLLATDYNNNRVCEIDLATNEVTTVAGGDALSVNRAGVGRDAGLFTPRFMTFDCTRRDATDESSVVFVTCDFALIRFNRATGDVRVMEMGTGLAMSLWGIVSLPNGMLIVVCQSNESLYLLDPSPLTAATTVTCHAPELLAGPDQPAATGYTNGSALGESRFDAPHGLCVIEAERCVLVADTSNHCVRRVTLPSHLFTPPAAGANNK